ncbi:TrkH family potassium uptake protein [Candidatus Contendibacter odensensis]|uniref:Potassium transporter n=1 Tax=Candidatus Contendobacter odensis Run_B_J11 TaxID=1400861 RepID=A0A7U7G9C1_9GAMM|nr:TrkH family potassium uptake protein [Candidatus Contendobacter odensis]CDH43592.1 potassium transporter [Candidatus Contendobacter odensis Run_B_J11]
MHDQTSHDGVAENAPPDHNAAKPDQWLEAKTALPPRLPSVEEPITVRPPVSQTLVGLHKRQARRSPLKTALHMVGLLMILFSATMLPPMAVAWWYDGYDVVLPFAEALGTMLGLGLLCWLPVCRFKVDLRNRDGFIVVVAFWFLLSLLGALPFMWSENLHMPLVDAVFETASGLTTTGATVLSGLDTLPKAIVYYRAQLNFLGGMGIVVLAVALLPMLGIGGMQLYKAETPGPMKDEKLTPRITETAKNLWFIYVGLNVLCTLSFWWGGMSLFDALCHSFATLALGGFSTHDASIGYFQSPAIELIAGFFSLVAAINFALYFIAWRTRSLKAIFRDAEFRFCMVVMGGIIVTACAYLYFSGKFPLWEAVYHGFFQTASVITDNGLGTTGYPADWPAFVPLLLLLGSFFGGCVGSTCGGIKAMRFLLLYKQSVREARLLIRPTAQIAVKLGNHPIPDRVMQAVWGFYYLYIFSYCFFSLALAATGVDLVTAFGSVAGCLNNMGIGLGETASNFAPLNDTATWLLSLSMLVGRLEVFPLLLIFLPDFWK